jgi:hypothetical protein
MRESNYSLCEPAENQLHMYTPPALREHCLQLCFAFLIAVLFLTDGLEQTYKQMAIYFSVSLALFIMGWPQFISFVRRLKQEPAITSVNTIASLSILPVLFFWSFALYVTGVFSATIAKYLQNAG